MRLSPGGHAPPRSSPLCPSPHPRTLAVSAIAMLFSLACSPALAAIDPLSGIDFVRIGAVGNAPWPGTTPPPPFGDTALGRGSVNYQYNIGKFEVNTAQWAEFYSAAFDRPVADRIPWLIPPTFWGAQSAPANTPGGLRWSVPAGNEMRPVGNISWRMAAIYCNWLHNGKSLDRSAFLNGAYDVSTFGGSQSFTDQTTHNPDARYWIPTWDEWLKAAHYDPEKNDGAGGWWLYSNGTDLPLTGGVPGVGEANFGFSSPDSFSILLGAYPQSQSPWGLLDVAGGTAEWTEGVVLGGQGIKWRIFDGSNWNSAVGTSIRDSAYARASEFPTTDFFDLGFRIASAVPSPPSVFVLAGGLGLSARRRRPAPTPASPRSTPHRAPASVALATLATLTVTAPSLAAIDPLSGIDFVTIGATYGGAGNAAYQSGIQNQRVNGRGSVGYEYNIGRMEVTTAQWVEFFNAAFDRPVADRIPWVAIPNFWGAQSAPANTPGGLRWSVPAGNENRPVGDISWRMAAIYCNWLHNGKSLDRSAFMSGAYDVSTFTFTGNRFNDQSAHSPGARYWIPTWDEWLKAAHFDPDKDNGDGTTGGWWQYANTSDTAPIYGPPGVGEANAGSFTSPDPFTISLGVYPDVQSPWGLLDVAGGTAEWTESVLDFSSAGKVRVFDGSFWTAGSFDSPLLDQIRYYGDDFPQIPEFPTGFRIASAVPSPGPCALGAGLCLLCVQRRRRSSCDARRRVAPFPFACCRPMTRATDSRSRESVQCS